MRRIPGTNSGSDCERGRVFLWREAEQIAVILRREEMNKRR